MLDLCIGSLIWLYRLLARVKDKKDTVNTVSVKYQIPKSNFGDKYVTSLINAITKNVIKMVNKISV